MSRIVKISLALGLGLFLVSGCRILPTIRRTATPLPPLPTRAITVVVPMPTVTPRPPTPRPTTPVPVVQPTNTARPNAAATLPPTPGLLRLTDPTLNSISPALSALPAGGRFQLLLTEAHLTREARSFIEGRTDLPVQLSDLTVSFVPGMVQMSARVPVSILRVEMRATGVWRAVDCRFEAQITDVRIANQPAPALVREQVEQALANALAGLTNSPVCFTGVDIRRGEVEITGYKR